MQEQIREIMERLRSIRVEVKKEILKIESKLCKFDMLRDLTEQEEREADALDRRQEALEAQLESIDSALSALSEF